MAKRAGLRAPLLQRLVLRNCEAATAEASGSVTFTFERAYTPVELAVMAG